MMLLRSAVLLNVAVVTCAFTTCSRRTTQLPSSFVCCHSRSASSRLFSSDWGDFSALEDDDDEILIDRTKYAKEEDTQEDKAAVGSALSAPTIENDAEPIVVPQGTILELSEENVLGLLSACREEIGTMFGYTEENRGVGITGGVDYVDMDGPTIILRLKGRFWHTRQMVLDRVASYLMGRIPEIIDVIVEDEWQLTKEANEQWK